MTSALRNPPANIVRQALVNTGKCADFDATSGWPAFALTVPALPDNLVTVHRGTDVIDARTMRGNLNIHHGVQLRVRSAVHDNGDAFARELQRWSAEDVYRLTVAGGEGVDSVGYLLLNFAKIGPVLDLGMNVPNDKRFNFTINMLAVIRPLY